MLRDLLFRVVHRRSRHLRANGILLISNGRMFDRRRSARQARGTQASFAQALRGIKNPHRDWRPRSPPKSSANPGWSTGGPLRRSDAAKSR